MKLSLFLIPIVLTKGFSDNQLQKRRFFPMIAGSADNILGSADNAFSASTAAVKNAVNSRILMANLLHIDRLLSAEDYVQAKFALRHFSSAHLVHKDLVLLAIKKGDQTFLEEVLNSKPRSVYGDLRLMKYARELARETGDSDRGDYVSSVIAWNMGNTNAVGNTGRKAYYDLFEGQFPGSKAEQLANKFLSEAKTEADQKVWRDILSDIEEYVY